MKITKEQVIEALAIVEAYKEQSISKLKQIEKDSDIRSVNCLNLPTRELNCLRSWGIKTIGELLSTDRDELRKCRNLGSKGICKINEALESIGVNTEFFSCK